MRNKIFFSIFCFIIGLATAHVVFAEVSRPVNLKEVAEVNSQMVCLSDVVEEGWLKNRCLVEKKLCCKWSLEGKREAIFKKSVFQAEAAKLNVAGIQVELVGPLEIKVKQTEYALSEEEIAKKLVDSVREKFKNIPDAKISVNFIRVHRPVYVSLEKDLNWAVQIPEKINTEVTNMKIVGPNKNVLGWVQASFLIQSEVFVARRNIQPGELIKETDFEVAATNILPFIENTSESAGAFRKGEFPVGVRSKHTLFRGAVLHGGVLERIPLVKLGDTVTLILRSDNLKISTKGVVQGAAAVGDMVTVQLPRYNRSFRGRLVEGRLVEVWL